MNEFLTNKLILTDTGVAAGNVNMYSNNGILYYNDQPIAPLTGITGNANEIIMVQIPLTSGVTDQQIVFPQSYDTIPKVVYSIRGQNKAQILGHQISDLSTGYVQVSFSHPVPDDQYTLFLFAWKSSNYLTLTGTAYEINAIHQAGAIRIDSTYGSVGGIRNRPDVPFQTLAQGISASISGDTIYLGSGNYLGQTISQNNLTFVFEEGATITTPLTLGTNVTGIFYNLQLEIADVNQAYGFTINNGSRAIFKDNNYISMPIGGATSRSSVAGAGTIELFGNLYHSHYINPSVTVTQRNNFIQNNITNSIFIAPFGASFTGGSGVNANYVFNNIDSGIAFASTGQKITVKPGNYAGFTLNKNNLSFEFEEGAVITSPITISASISGNFSNLNQVISSINSTGIGILVNANSLLSLENTNRINFPNLVNQSFTAITGVGIVQCLGDIYYGVPVANNLNFTFTKGSTASSKYYVSTLNNSVIPSGANGNMYFNNIQDAVSFASGHEKINVLNGTYSGFTVSNSHLQLYFNDDVIVNSPITLNTSSAKTYFHNLALDVQSNTGIDYGILINSGATGVFKDNSYIRIPAIRSPYLIDFSGNSLYKITGVFTNDFTIAPSGSGYYISGNNTLVVSGFSGSGISYLNRFSVSGAGNTAIFSLLSNTSGFTGILDTLNAISINSGSFFSPSDIYFIQ